MKRHDTAGKGPGLVLRSHDGAVRLTLDPQAARGVLEILQADGFHASVTLKPGNLKELAKALLKVASALELERSGEEITQH